MIQGAKRIGLDAEYLVADAWFGIKTMVRTALKHDVCAILCMKKSALKYRVAINGRKKELLNAKALYKHVVKKKWQKVRGLPWKAVSIQVEMDLSEDKHSPEWKTVNLLFSYKYTKEFGFPSDGTTQEKRHRKKLENHFDGQTKDPLRAFYTNLSKVTKQVWRFLRSRMLKKSRQRIYEGQLRPMMMVYV